MVYFINENDFHQLVSYAPKVISGRDIFHFDRAADPKPVNLGEQLHLLRTKQLARDINTTAKVLIREGSEKCLPELLKN
ncbi:hypothetical protein [Ornithinibacillus bavariensis]|uniref:hypothetical protein n=1 Tax=Ornithinibacillus bavariensis TaxID=545502 RepID=UPI000EE9508E|nr:hypothetical protein [Ornithinibacillus sp.]